MYSVVYPNPVVYSALYPTALVYSVVYPTKVVYSVVYPTTIFYSVVYDTTVFYSGGIIIYYKENLNLNWIHNQKSITSLYSQFSIILPTLYCVNWMCLSHYSSVKCSVSHYISV